MATAEALAKKRRIRAGHKASASRMIRQVEETLGKDPVDSTKLSLLKCSLQEKLETLKTLDGEIIDLIDDDKLAEEIEQADAFKETIYEAIIKIDKATSKTAPPSPASPDTDRRDATSSSPSTCGKSVKLPKLSLRSFNGDITAWSSF